MMVKSKKKITLKQGCLIAIIIYFAVMAIFWVCSYDELNFRNDSTDMLQNISAVPEITKDIVFTQNFKATYNGNLTGITFLMGTFARTNTNHLMFKVFDGEEQIAESIIDASTIRDNARFTVPFEQTPMLKKNSIYMVEVTSPDGESGNATTIYVGTEYVAGKVSIVLDMSEAMQTHINGAPLGCSFCWEINTRADLLGGKIYPFVALGVGIVLVSYCVYMIVCEKRGRSCVGLRTVNLFKKYRYLLKQLVSRDFKTKYKRSVLGVLWSFLNPVLMTTVQFVVFSKLFSSSIENFVLYLIIGIVCFNFFNECASMCLSSIVINASLITKVYMPKYIYPVSRALSSCVNLLFSLIPIVGIMIVTGSPISKALVLVPIPLICLFIFSLGVGMILSTMMVFFRDTQFLWGVLSTILMYVTPIIYPESILPNKIMWLVKLNPLYHIIKSVRSMIMDGISPEPMEYIIMLGTSFLVLLAGAVIFRKNQDKFVLNL